MILIVYTGTCNRQTLPPVCVATTTSLHHNLEVESCKSEVTGVVTCIKEHYMQPTQSTGK